MDAKPQRPRGLPRLRDENIPPAGAAPLKALHQRNKSTPALSTLLQGINANPPKRAAFADVSNTIRTNAVKDDMILQQKVAVEKVALKSSKESAQEQFLPTLQMAKSAALLRPAQRPLSAAIQKSALPPINEPFASLVSKRLVEQSGDANIGKTITKRQTTVFKETETVAPETRVTATVPPVPLPAREESLKEGVTNEKATHGVSIAPLVLQRPDPQPTVEGHEPPSYSETFDGILPPVYSKLKLQASILEQADSVQPKSDDIEEFLPALESQIKEIDPILDMKTIPSVIHEIDEYWDEEDDEEFYDAEGYTTARSFRSKGENTTGGMTIVLAPKVTARVERELVAARVFVESTRTEDDIDDEAWDTTMVAEYGEEIFQYMRELEERMRPNPYYMDNQAEIQWSMRSVLMDWLTQVHSRFQLLQETLFLAVNYIDRFLSCKIVSLGKLQLVGATALFVAAKYEEINCPSVQEIVYMVDGGYTMEEILKAERFMLSMLQFELGWPGPLSFLRRISKADDYDIETRTLAKYFLEVMIMDERFVGCTPSFTAAGAHCLARLMLGKGDWSLAHIHYSQYTYPQLRHLLATILECCHDQRKHHAAVFEKYTDKRYKKAAIFVEDEIQNGFTLPPVRRDSSINGHSQSWRRK